MSHWDYVYTSSAHRLSEEQKAGRYAVLKERLHELVEKARRNRDMVFHLTGRGPNMRILSDDGNAEFTPEEFVATMMLLGEA